MEIVRRVCAEWERGNFQTPEVFDPDVHVVWVNPILVPAAETHGLEELGARMREFLEAWGSVTATAEEILDAGDKVVCFSVWHARGRESGVPVEDRQANVWTFVDGRATRLVNYGDRAKALQDAGLSE